LTRKGASREEAYRLVQKNAMQVWQEGGQLKDRLKRDEAVMHLLSPQEIDSIFDLGFHLKHLDSIYKRVFEGG